LQKIGCTLAIRKQAFIAFGLHYLCRSFTTRH
jgi:hypothetical protein